MQNFGGGGGNGAALRHFEATGKKYPLVVKLGTITPQGADVYSYAEDEDDMVLDPHLVGYCDSLRRQTQKSAPVPGWPCYIFGLSVHAGLTDSLLLVRR